MTEGSTSGVRDFVDRLPLGMLVYLFVMRIHDAARLFSLQSSEIRLDLVILSYLVLDIIVDTDKLLATV